MASNTQGANDSPNYDRSRYFLEIRLVPDHNITKNPQLWLVTIQLHCHDLPQLMREGLFWTTSNVAPGLGYFEESNSKSSRLIKPFSVVRGWKLSEFADKQCRWSGGIYVNAHSVQTVSSFQIHWLSRQNISRVRATDKQGRGVFEYNHQNPGRNINCIYDDLQPSRGSWWFWPMESVPHRVQGCVEKPEVSTYNPRAVLGGFGRWNRCLTGFRGVLRSLRSAA
ncbi:hypothetical protein QBC46DRAFT_377663 [Diplogelasinospora grovesii]|uniref:Uncharacterized protein n=1 Tax=Diplogelasinospora grovesii TaxID=303347 RepID=A0AAN6NCQ7_9PEZI|nr:hypothetical protein QBC46DRAFT_377663 [Diplogelasinospora grovesii]